LPRIFNWSGMHPKQKNGAIALIGFHFDKD
jgi:hypothetical protein